MPSLSVAVRQGDPFDGRGARVARIRRRIVRWALALVVIMFLALLVTRLPSIDTAAIVRGFGKPILAGALLSLLAVSVLLALARIKTAGRNH
jgi:hypothetical protein